MKIVFKILKQPLRAVSQKDKFTGNETPMTIL